MRFYTGATGKKAFVKELKARDIGRVNCPDKYRRPYRGEKWICDNGAYSLWLKGSPFDDDRYLKYLDRLSRFAPPQFAVLPDIVAQGVRSIDFSMYWATSDRLPDWPWYLALQDGIDENDLTDAIPFIDGLFIGGTLRFKATARQWVEFGQKHGKPVHYGRCGVHDRIHYAYLAGCDSVDSGLPLRNKQKFARFLTWVKEGHYDPQSYRQLLLDI